MGAVPVDWSVNCTIIGELPCITVDVNLAFGAPDGTGLGVRVVVGVGVGVGVSVGVVVPAGVRMKLLLLISLTEVWLMLWTQTL